MSGPAVYWIFKMPYSVRSATILYPWLKTRGGMHEEKGGEEGGGEDGEEGGEEEGRRGLARGGGRGWLASARGGE